MHLRPIAKTLEVLAHTAGYHSMEGKWVWQYLLTVIVHYAD